MSTAESQRAFEANKIVVMGVSGSGKSTIGAQVAARLGLRYVDGDDLHPTTNVAKMRGGTPLTDDDRWPWLDRIGATLREAAASGAGCVIACSALKRSYRDRLRQGAGEGTRFVFLDASFAVIDARLAKRIHHFMPESLLRSQFATLERPAADETDVITESVEKSAEEIVDDVVVALRRG